MTYSLCGLQVVSDLPLPELQPGSEDSGEPELEIRLGPVPDRLADRVTEGPFLQVGADGTCRYEIAGVAAFLVQRGRLVVVHPQMAVDAPDIRLFLLGSVFGLLCYQRGWLPLHACCVELGGDAVAIAADSGIGKSTLAAAFARAGHRVLADDVTVVDAHAPGGPLVMPALPRLRLWRDVLQVMRIAPEGLEPCRNRMEKFQLPLRDSFRTDPLPLAAVYRLGRVAEERHAGLTPLSGLDAVDALLLSVYRRQAANRMGLTGQVMRAIHQVLRRPCLSLNQVHGLERLDETVSLLEARHRAGKPG